MEWIWVDCWWIWIHIKMVSANNRILLVVPLLKICLYKQWCDNCQMWLRRSLWAQQPLTWWMQRGSWGIWGITVHLCLTAWLRAFSAGPQLAFWPLFLLSLLWIGSVVWGSASVDSGSVSSALFDGNCYSFVLCPTTSRPPSCHLCALPHPIPSQGHEMMPKDPSGGFFSTLLDLQLKANCSPDEWQNPIALEMQRWHPHFRGRDTSRERVSGLKSPSQW